jgi:hypothetical protein
MAENMMELAFGFVNVTAQFMLLRYLQSQIERAATQTKRKPRATTVSGSWTEVTQMLQIPNRAQLECGRQEGGEHNVMQRASHVHDVA